MNKKELFDRLTAEGVPPSLYSLEGGLSDDHLCLNQTYNGWEVYYTERGKKFDVKEFLSEEHACDYLYNQLKRLMKFI